MAAFLRSHGVRAASVHSGEGSAPRAQSLDRLRSGQLEVLCAVDMFNEGVDVPSIDTVLMLRPTESSVIWLQQLGRGLRRAQGKTHLTVVDFIGNHKVFLDRPTWLLGSYGLSDSWETRVELIAQALTHDVRLPEGCEVHFDLELLETFLEQLKGAEAFSLQRAMLAHATGVPPDREALRVGQEVYRADIPRRFKYTFQSATWNQGFVVQERDVFLFVTLEKGDMQSAHQYRDTFLSTESFQWQSQNRTAQSSRAGEVIRDHARLNYAVHLWVRPSKKYRQQSVPFVYCGQVDFVSWRGEKPITVQWSLRTALTKELCRYLQPSLLVEP
jgi:hypothetical protein